MNVCSERTERYFYDIMIFVDRKHTPDPGWHAIFSSAALSCTVAFATIVAEEQARSVVNESVS
jgi:hypothetical protein